METQVEVTLNENIEVVVNMPNGRQAFLTLEPGSVGRETLWITNSEGRKIHGLDLNIFNPK
jgi:hypothetical protein